MKAEELTQEFLAPYLGGQMEIQSQGRREVWRGEIEAIAMLRCRLHVKFAWLAKGVVIDHFPLPEKWIVDSELDYSVGLLGVIIEDIGPDSEGGNRLMVCTSEGYALVLFSKNGSKLSRAKVIGLDF